MNGNECSGLQICNNVWMYFIEALNVCTLKFDCEWGNGMGPQGLGMVPWESPSGLLSPTVPWVQWYWTFTGLRGTKLELHWVKTFETWKL